MAKKKKTFETILDFANYFRSEKFCVQYFIKMRWNCEVTCQNKECFHHNIKDSGNKVYLLEDGESFKCNKCNRIFSYKVGTIFENSKITMKNWFMAIYLKTSHKKGISSVQLSKYLKIRQATAWFMLQRLKHVVDTNMFKESFSDTVVEADELYVGGKEGNKHVDKRFKDTKAVVLGIVDRNKKEVKTFHVKDSKYSTLGQKIIDNVELGSTLITDDYSAYKTLKNFYEHETVNHSAGEYVKVKRLRNGLEAAKIHTNNIEGYWSLVRRTIYGTHHWVSKKHLQRYLSEISYRFNMRFISNSNKFTDFVSKVEGRLKYKDLIVVV
jgi:transposase-like protein